MKESAVCMVREASFCTERYKSRIFAYTDYKNKSYDDMKLETVNLPKCAEDTVKDASKATKNAPDCGQINALSTSDAIATCVRSYRENVLQKPERENTYAKYNDCARKAPISEE